MKSQIAEEIERLIGKGAAEGLDFEAIETAARREAMKIAARAVEKKAQSKTSPIMKGPFCLALAGGVCAMRDDDPRRSSRHWAR